MTTRCPICGGGPTCPAGRYTPGPISARARMTRSSGPIGHSTATPSPTSRRGRYWCIPLVDQCGWRLVRMGTSAARRFSLHFGVRPTWVGQCDYAIYVAPQEDTP
ncbi:MAG: hypothetical protein KatS3mg038_0762 [Candidatus Kapaibacterium sp.]|nr:MAG: hypothetical protein KatS3mg038_0762 [Candidatus Kapabacteria bacterium]